MTPGSAFFKTSLIDMLQQDGIHFKMIQSNNITKALVNKQSSNLWNKNLKRIRSIIKKVNK